MKKEVFGTGTFLFLVLFLLLSPARVGADDYCGIDKTCPSGDKHIYENYGCENSSVSGLCYEPRLDDGTCFCSKVAPLPASQTCGCYAPPAGCETSVAPCIKKQPPDYPRRFIGCCPSDPVPTPTPVCNDSAPDTPTLSSPASLTQVRVGSAVSLGWNAVASWGKNCDGNNNRYEVCVMSDASCDLVNYFNNGTSLTYNWTPLAADSVVSWKIRANNGAESATSVTRTVCAEGFDASNPAYVSVWTPACGSQTRTCTEDCGTDDCAPIALTNCQHCAPTISLWSTCNSSHKQTRTCTENDGLCDGDDCADVVIERDCIGTITGTLFDASDVSDSCTPGEMAASAKYVNQPFSINGLNWPIISASAPTVTTNASGVYSQSVYASTLPANYVFDYTDLFNSGLAAGVKTECGVSMVAVTGNETNDQVVTKNTGFWRVYGGWWQAVGGNVYAETGLKSYIPASVLPLTNQKLILADADGRTGVLSHGFSWAGSELGTNPNVAVSSSLWRIESLYEGLRYDYDFYKTRMDIFASTPWTGGGISYNDGGTGYQIFKGSGDLGLSATTLTAGQKAILLVDGSVSVNGDLVVPDGAFLGVIAKNGITFGAGVDTAQGWFVAEIISVSCNETAGVCNQTDTQFDGQGSFVGWSGISLNRDMYTGNNTAPSEKFTYRADMYINAPAPMKVYSKKFSPFIP